MLCYTRDQKVKSYSLDLIKILGMCFYFVFTFNSTLEACALQIKITTLNF